MKTKSKLLQEVFLMGIGIMIALFTLNEFYTIEVSKESVKHAANDIASYYIQMNK